VGQERKVMELGGDVDDAAVRDYKQRIAAATQRGGQEGGVPLGGAKPLAGTPVMSEAGQRQPPVMPEQETEFTADDLRDSIRGGGIGAGPAADPGAPAPPMDPGIEPQAAAAPVAPPSGPEGDPGELEGAADAKQPIDPELFRMLMQQPRDQLDNVERREAIEARCKDIDLRHYVVGRGGIQQVPIIPNVFVPTFRALSGQEDMFAKRFTWDLVTATAGGKPSQMYHDTVMGMVQVALSVTHINDEEMLDHRRTNGEVDEEVFDKKFYDLLTRPFVILQDLWLNHGWFDDRIRDAINVGTLGNG